MILFCTTPFVQMARMLVTASGAPNLRIAEVGHPLGGLREAEVLTRATDVTAQVMALLDLGVPS